jgi:hypothetical protein
MGLLKRQEGAVDKTRAGVIEKYLEQKELHAVIVYPDQSVFVDKNDKVGRMQHMREVMNEDKQKLLQHKEAGWDTKIRAGGKGFEYDYLVTTLSTEESRQLRNDEEAKIKLLNCISGVLSRSSEHPGVKASISSLHEDTQNIHVHTLLHRHPVDVENKSIGNGEMLTKGHGYMVDLTNRLNNELEKQGFQARVYEILGEDGKSLLDDIKKQKEQKELSADGQEQIRETIQKKGGVVERGLEQKIITTSRINVEASDLNAFGEQNLREMQQIQAQIEKLEAQKNIRAENYAMAQKAQAVFNENAILKPENENLKKSVAEYEVKVAIIEKQRDSYKEDVMKTFDELNSVQDTALDLASKNEELFENLNQKEKDYEVLSIDYDELEKEHEEVLQHRAKLEKTSIELFSINDSLNGEIDVLEKNLKTIKQEIITEREQHSETKQELELVKSHYSKEKENHNKSKDQISTLKSEIDAYKQENILFKEELKEAILQYQEDRSIFKDTLAGYREQIEAQKSLFVQQQQQFQREKEFYEQKLQDARNHFLEQQNLLANKQKELISKEKTFNDLKKQLHQQQNFQESEEVEKAQDVKHELHEIQELKHDGHQQKIKKEKIPHHLRDFNLRDIEQVKIYDEEIKKHFEQESMKAPFKDNFPGSIGKYKDGSHLVAYADKDNLMAFIKTDDDGKVKEKWGTDHHVECAISNTRSALMEMRDEEKVDSILNDVEDEYKQDSDQEGKMR